MRALTHEGATLRDATLLGQGCLALGSDKCWSYDPSDLPVCLAFHFLVGSPRYLSTCGQTMTLATILLLGCDPD